LHSRNESDVSGLQEERDTHNATVASSSREIPFCLTRRRIKQTSLICAKCSGALREHRSRFASYFATRSSIVGALVKLSTTSDERDRSRACAIMMARCFSQSPGINCRYAPTDVVVVTPRGASLKHASLADALLRDARGIVSLRFFVSNWTSIFPDAMSENDFIARDRWFWENDSDVKKDLVFRLHSGSTKCTCWQLVRKLMMNLITHTALN